jgi:hypothetical protein
MNEQNGLLGEPKPTLLQNPKMEMNGIPRELKPILMQNPIKKAALLERLFSSA